MDLYFRDAKQTQLGEGLATLHEPNVANVENGGDQMTNESTFTYVDSKQNP
jgi:hypothetical protein